MKRTIRVGIPPVVLAVGMSAWLSACNSSGSSESAPIGAMPRASFSGPVVTSANIGDISTGNVLPMGFSVADLNGDGKPDVIFEFFDSIGGRGAAVVMLLGNGD